VPLSLHFITDLLAASVGSAAGWWLYRQYLVPVGISLSDRHDRLYWPVLVVSAVLGAYWLGTLNLVVSGHTGIGRSVFGAVIGGIAGIEIYKALRGMRGSTGAVFVLPLSLGLAVGRIGCFFAGMADFTYGSPTSLLWAWDFGDGIGRHPVQLYESAAMLAFAAGFLVWAKARPRLAATQGFYFFAAWFAADRFLLEFLKPYGRIVNALTVFQIGAVFLFIYAAVMLWGEWRKNAKSTALSVLRTDNFSVRDMPVAGSGQDPHRG